MQLSLLSVTHTVEELQDKYHKDQPSDPTFKSSATLQIDVKLIINITQVRKQKHLLKKNNIPLKYHMKTPIPWGRSQKPPYCQLTPVECCVSSLCS